MPNTVDALPVRLHRLGFRHGPGGELLLFPFGGATRGRLVPEDRADAVARRLDVLRWAFVAVVAPVLLADPLGLLPLWPVGAACFAALLTLSALGSWASAANLAPSTYRLADLPETPDTRRAERSMWAQVLLGTGAFMLLTDRARGHGLAVSLFSVGFGLAVMAALLWALDSVRRRFARRRTPA